MAFRFRARLPVLALLLLAGCDFGATDPVSLGISFIPAHRLLEDGSCQVQFVAEASGFGSAEWTRVVIRRSGTVTSDLSGAETAQFWGDRRITAGQRQVSVPFTAPNAGANVEVEVFYRISGPERNRPLPVQGCASS